MRYILHSANICSKTDGQSHFISCHKLMKLYGLNKKDCYFINNLDDTLGFKNQNGDIHLFPRYDGNYRLPINPINKEG